MAVCFSLHGQSTNKGAEEGIMDIFRDQSSWCLFDSFTESVSFNTFLFSFFLSFFAILLLFVTFDPFTILQTISV